MGAPAKKNPYREPDSIGLVSPVERHRGPRKLCPACGYGSVRPETRNTKDEEFFIGGTSIISAPTYCTHARRLLLSGRWWWKEYCALSGEHLHQSCYQCGAAWVCDTAEGNF